MRKNDLKLLDMLRARPFLRNRFLSISPLSGNHYKVLEIERSATKDEIKKAHKAIARKFHPDRPGGDKDRFIAAQEAFECLSDATSREKYDDEIFGKKRESQEYDPDRPEYMAPGVFARKPELSFTKN